MLLNMNRQSAKSSFPVISAILLMFHFVSILREGNYLNLIKQDLGNWVRFQADEAHLVPTKRSIVRKSIIRLSRSRSSTQR